MANRRLRRLDLDGVRAGYIGTGIWVVLAVFATLFAGFLNDHDILWWRDVTYAGIVVGLLGIRHVVRRRNRLRQY